MSSMVLPDELPSEYFDPKSPMGGIAVLDPRPPPPSVDYKILMFSTLAHEDDIRKQIGDLGKLEDGWLDGEGEAFDQEGLSVLEDRLIRHYRPSAPELILFPTEEGAVQAEWWIGGRHAALEMFLDRDTAEWSDFDPTTKKRRTRSVNLDAQQDWNWIIKRLRSLK